MGLRRASKEALAQLARLDGERSRGITLLTYHRVGGGTTDELDLPLEAFEQQLDVLVDGGHEVLGLDAAIDRLDGGDARPAVVLTFDDGFEEVHAKAFPGLLERHLPFTLYLVAGLVGGSMTWLGSEAASQGAPALTWDAVEEMYGSGLCTIGNHTFTHARPSELDADELDQCSEAIEGNLGVRPVHFAWTWGVQVDRMVPSVRQRFRSVATGSIGRNLPGGDQLALRRVPVRGSDPLGFFEAKLDGRLWPERSYERAVHIAKAGARVVGRA